MLPYPSRYLSDPLIRRRLDSHFGASGTLGGSHLDSLLLANGRGTLDAEKGVTTSTVT